MNIALYANSRPRVATYLPLAKELEKRNYNCVLYHPSDFELSEIELEGYEDVNIEKADGYKISSLKGIDLFFSPEVAYKQIPEGSIAVALLHSLPDRDILKTNYIYWLKRHKHITCFDYLVVAVKQKPRDWLSSAYQPYVAKQSTNNIRSAFDLVPGGYPKLDYLTEKLATKDETDCILYCPTKSDNEASEVMPHGADLIKALHEEFKNFNIVFRPYPNDNKDAINSVIARCNSLDRFIVDRTVTGLEYQRRCAVMVTDKSSVAITFSICSYRPSIFSEISSGIRGDHEDLVIPNIIGMNAYRIDGVIEAIHRAIDNQSAWTDIIHKARQSHIYHPYDSSKYLSSNAETLCRGESHSEWLSISRPFSD